MTLAELLDRMFPGEPERGLPSFTSACPQFETLLAETIRRPLAGAALAHDAALSGEDVNDGLKAMRREAPEVLLNFILAALEAYFSAPVVIRSLRGGSEVLFPHARVLPEIDYDLLAPVIERSEEGTTA